MIQTSRSLWELPLLCPGRYDDRVGIVTGGASGIGEATVVRMLREGGRVVIADVNVKGGTRMMETIREHGFADQARFLMCNVTSEREMNDLLKWTEREFGRLDLMVNCAGAGGAVGGFLDIATDSWDDTFALLSRSGFLGTRLAAQMMIRQKIAGAIVNVSSVAAYLPGCGGTAYAAAKAAMVNYTKMAAAQLGSKGIRCNLLCPGSIITPLLKKSDQHGDLLEKAFVNSQPWPSAGRPEHIAAGILFLGSDQAAFITGASLCVDGGLVAGGPILCEWQTYEELAE